MNLISKGAISLLIASLLAGPFITGFAQIDEEMESESNELELTLEESIEATEVSESILDSSVFLDDELEEELIEVPEVESILEEESIVAPPVIEIKNGIKADDLSLIKEGSAGQWIMKLDWERINPYLANLDEVSRQEAVKLLTQSQMVFSMNASEMARAKVNEAGIASFDIAEPLAKGSLLEFDLPEIKSETFKLRFDTLEIVVEGLDEEVILVEDGLHPWDLMAIESGNQGKWSVELDLESINTALEEFPLQAQQAFKEALTANEMILSVNGEEYARQALGEAGLATFEITEDLPEWSEVTFSVDDIEWSGMVDKSLLTYSLRLQPLVIEVGEVTPSDMDSLSEINKVDVTSAATTSVVVDEWLDYSAKRENGKIIIQGILKTEYIYDEIKKSSPGYNFPSGHKKQTLTEIAKTDIYVKIIGQTQKEQVNVIHNDNLNRLEFVLEYSPLDSSNNLLTFQFGDREDGRVLAGSRGTQYYVYFNSISTSISLEKMHINSVTPRLEFNEVPFSNEGVINHPAEDIMMINLTDNRSVENAEWKLSVQATGGNLAGASIVFKNGILTSDNPTLGFSYTPSDTTITIGGEKNSFRIVTKKDMGVTAATLALTLNYAPENILLSIPSSTMMNLDASQTYSTTINWTLTKGP